MSEPLLSITTQEKLAIVTLNRPEKCNAINGALVEQLQEAFFAASRDPQVQGILLKGEGQHFCAGADIEWMQQVLKGSFEKNRDDARSLASLLYQMYSFPKPIITLAQGSVLGGGLGLLACSDIVIAAAETIFCFSESKIGLVPAVVSPYVIAAIGEHAARYYFLTAEQFNAAEAQRLGLIHRIVPAATLIKAGHTSAAALLKNSPEALAEIKRLVPLVANQPMTLELSEKTAEMLAKVRGTPQAKEGLSAFLEKRPPSWR